jgi:protein TonB
VYYHPNGFLDSSGHCVKDVPDGDWWFHDREGFTTRKKTYRMGMVIKDSAITRVPQELVQRKMAEPGEVESSFKGGSQGWMRYMNAHFKYPERALNAGVGGTVVLQFIVDENGRVQDPGIHRSAEYSLDEEALRLIKTSPAWVPATKDGKPVKSYKRQPITFNSGN